MGDFNVICRKHKAGVEIMEILNLNPLWSKYMVVLDNGNLRVSELSKHSHINRTDC